jgi:hypothetical protein
MTRKRMLTAAAAVALTLGLGTGIAAAQADDDPSPMDDMDAMHAEMRADMPEDMQAQCDTMHARGNPVTGSGMMNGPMVGGGMMGAGMSPRS